MSNTTFTNLFELIPVVRRAFEVAVARVRLIATEKYHGHVPPESAVNACAATLENAARQAEILIPFTVELPDAEISPECMAALARDTITVLHVLEWEKLEARADELRDGKWLVAIEEWEEGRGEVADEAA